MQRIRVIVAKARNKIELTIHSGNDKACDFKDLIYLGNFSSTTLKYAVLFYKELEAMY